MARCRVKIDTLKSFWAWLYWIVEALIITSLVVHIGYDVGRRPFSMSAKDWYHNLPAQIGSVDMDNKAQLLESLAARDLHSVSKLVTADGETFHPRIEIYQQKTIRQWDVLVTIKETRINEKGQIKRRVLQQWELSSIRYDELRYCPRYTRQSHDLWFIMRFAHVIV